MSPVLRPLTGTAVAVAVWVAVVALLSGCADSGESVVLASTVPSSPTGVEATGRAGGEHPPAGPADRPGVGAPVPVPVPLAPRQLRPVGQLLAGVLFYPVDQARDALRFYRELMATAMHCVSSTSVHCTWRAQVAQSAQSS